jgi:hypothetical protein
MISSSDSAIRDVRSGLPNPSGERLGYTAISDGREWVSFETRRQFFLRRIDTKAAGNIARAGARNDFVNPANPVRAEFLASEAESAGGAMGLQV